MIKNEKLAEEMRQDVKSFGPFLDWFQDCCEDWSINRVFVFMVVNEGWMKSTITAEKSLNTTIRLHHWVDLPL